MFFGAYQHYNFHLYLSFCVFEIFRISQWPVRIIFCVLCHDTAEAASSASILEQLAATNFEGKGIQQLKSSYLQKQSMGFAKPPDLVVI